MTFEEYLTSKKIDSQAFARAQTSIWEEWRQLFSEMHPNSFTVQKLNLINKIRREFPLMVEETVAAITTATPDSPPAKVVVRTKPIIKPKIN